MQFVFPVPTYLLGKMFFAARLYAYPTIPEILETTPKSPFVMLDSGAFHLAKAKKGYLAMDEAYMSKLALHYEKYKGERIYRIAPDVFLNPRQTIKNWERWHKNGYPADIVPVIQCEKKKRYSWKIIYEQTEVYREWQCPIVCFSNPGMRAHESPELLSEIITMIRERTGAQHIHNLGAGWDVEDVREWRRQGIFDSIDSISYYNSTRSPEVAIQIARQYMACG